MNINELIGKVAAARDESARLSKLHKTAKDTQKNLEEDLMAALETAGLDRAGNGNKNVSIKEETVPSVTDWEKVYKYIIDNNAFYLLHKRMSADAYRELANNGIQLPGTEPFTQYKLSVLAA